MDSNKKRNRLPNFSSAEESLLLTLAEEHGNLIENKRTDAVSWEEKRKVWEQIDYEFEAQMGVKRGPKNLREKYENLKRKARKCLAQERREVYKTGGGQFKPCTDPNTDRLAALMGKSATGLSTDFDSDAIELEIEPLTEFDPSTEILEESMTILEPLVEGTEAVENDESTDWRAWNPTLLRKKPNEKLDVKGKRKERNSDFQQVFWKDENRRAEEKHSWLEKKYSLEIREAEMKLQLLQIEIDFKKQQSLSEESPI